MQKLVDKLLSTFKSEWGLLPPYLWFDFIAERLGDGSVTVCLNKVGELGSSPYDWNNVSEILDVVFADFLKRSECARASSTCSLKGHPNSASPSAGTSCLGGVCQAFEGFQKVVREAMDALHGVLPFSGRLACGACSVVHRSATACEECGAVACEDCRRQSALQKLDFCVHCKAAFCRKCIVHTLSATQTMAQTGEKLSHEGSISRISDVQPHDWQSPSTLPTLMGKSATPNAVNSEDLMAGA
jgi:hypothetical protein